MLISWTFAAAKWLCYSCIRCGQCFHTCLPVYSARTAGWKQKHISWLWVCNSKLLWDCKTSSTPKWHLQPSSGCLLPASSAKPGEHHQQNVVLQLHLRRQMWLIKMTWGERGDLSVFRLLGHRNPHLHLAPAPSAQGMQVPVWKGSCGLVTNQTNMYFTSYPQPRRFQTDFNCPTSFFMYLEEFQWFLTQSINWQSPFINSTHTLTFQRLSDPHSWLWTFSPGTRWVLVWLAMQPVNHRIIE